MKQHRVLFSVTFVVAVLLFPAEVRTEEESRECWSETYWGDWYDGDGDGNREKMSATVRTCVSGDTICRSSTYYNYEVGSGSTLYWHSGESCTGPSSGIAD